MTEQDTATQHPDLDQLQEPTQGLGDRLRAAAEKFIPPLPEDSWAAPKQRPPADPLDESATTTSDRGDVDSLYDPSETAASTGSTKALASFRRNSAKLYGGMATAMAAMISGLVNWRLREFDEDDLWLMSKQEAAGIGEPLGRIAARRATLPVDGSEDDTNDVIDGMQAAIAAVGYLGRVMMERSDRRRPQQAPMPGQEQVA
jgi:hypothetical protein